VAAFVVSASAGLFCFAQSGAAQLPLSLKAADAERLMRGEALIRELGSYRDLALTASGASAESIRNAVKKLKPNYLSEVVALVPRREAAIELLAAKLADVKGYVGIQYWSKRQKTYYDLFDTMEIVSRKTIPGGEEIETRQHMEPFSEYSCRYTYRIAASAQGQGSELYFASENLSKISYSYQGIDAVSAGDMIWMLYAFPSGDWLVFYGVGAVKAFDMFGVIRDRLKTSFLGRIESFFGAMLDKMKS
jgi:hypothetical protein